MLSAAVSSVRAIASACAIAIALSASFDARAEKRVAIVVGNNAYESVSKLERAVSDARAVSAQLETLGFRVQVATDVGRRDLVRQLSAFMDQIEPGDVALLYYAGHGVEIRGANYILPTDIPPVRQGQESLLTGEAISTDKVIADLQDRGARAIVFVLDACRDNPFKTNETRSLGGARGLAQGAPPEGVFVLYSAGVGQSALDRMGGNDTDPNSVFTRIFLKEIRKTEFPLVSVAKSVQVAVRDLSLTVSHTQVPAYYDQIIGQFYLSRDGAALAKADPPAPSAASPADAGGMPQPAAGRPVFTNRAFSEYVSRNSQFARSQIGNPNAVANCDRLASFGVDVPDSRAPRVELQKINFNEAMPACVAAVMQDPATPRFRAQMARALARSPSKADNASGVNILLDLATDGYPAAMWRIGVIYYAGTALKEDKRAAADWFRRAADKGLGVAMSDLAYLYYSGDGVPKDIGEAARWSERAAATGHPSGMRNYAFMLDHGEAGARNPRQADTRAQVQVQLTDFGFYRGRTDGQFDAATFAALNALQSSNPVGPGRKP